MGRLCIVDGEILFRWGRFCSDTESSVGDFISAKERICFGETLFRDTGLLNMTAIFKSR